MTIQEIIESIDYCLECDNDRIQTTQDDLQTIKEALEKQIPYKPYNFSLESCKDGSVFVCSVLVCGNCNGIMDLLQGELNYCPNCGQAIDWNEYND